MTKKRSGVPSIAAQVAEMEPRHYTRTQAADIVGRTIGTLTKWEERGKMVPKRVMLRFGKTQEISVRVYSEADIARMRRIIKATSGNVYDKEYVENGEDD